VATPLEDRIVRITLRISSDQGTAVSLDDVDHVVETLLPLIETTHNTARGRFAVAHTSREDELAPAS
jgi:hypothetical protein